MKKDSLYAIGNAIFLAAVLVVNYLAATVGLNGLKTGEISDGIKSLFTPSGYVFSIWGLIYVLLIIFVVSQFFPKNRDSVLLEKIGYWFMISCVLNIAWMFVWHYKMNLLSLVIMICLFLSLMMIYLRVSLKKGDEPGKSCFFIRIPFSIYFGWISVALIANVSTFLVVSGWNGFGISPEVWTVVVLIIATLLAIAMTIVKKDVLYPLVFVWAFFGIVHANTGIQLIVVTGYICIAVILIDTVVNFWLNLPKK